MSWLFSYDQLLHIKLIWRYTNDDGDDVEEDVDSENDDDGDDNDDNVNGDYDDGEDCDDLKIQIPVCQFWSA